VDSAGAFTVTLFETAVLKKIGGGTTRFAEKITCPASAAAAISETT
jgi:hypothetical protein